MSLHTFRVFDSHVNIGHGELSADPIKSNITAEKILDLMQQSGIERSLIFPVSRPGGYAEANKEVAEIARQHPRDFLGFGRIRSHPFTQSRRPSRAPIIGKLSRRLSILRKKTTTEFAEECQEELRKCFADYGLHGIKVHPDEDGFPSAAVLTTLQTYNKPLLLHCGRGISLARIEEEIIKPFAMPVILAHMGGFPAVRKMYFQALDLARNYPHVYLNTSFVFYQYILELAVSACPSKVIFGSDAPGVHPLTALSSILTLRTSDEIKQMVLWGNMANLMAGARENGA